jgi:hypothetical protein
MVEAVIINKQQDLDGLHFVCLATLNAAMLRDKTVSRYAAVYRW